MRLSKGFGSFSLLVLAACGGGSDVDTEGHVFLVDNTPKPASAAVIGIDDPFSPAAKAGLVTWDVIQTIDGEPVSSWSQAAPRLTDSHVLTVKSGDDPERTVHLALAPEWVPLAGTTDAVGRAYGLFSASTFVYSVIADSPAAKSKLVAGDHMVALDGTRVASFTELVAAMPEPEAGDAVPSVALTVVRDGEPVLLSLLPERRLTTDGMRLTLGIVRHPAAAE